MMAEPRAAISVTTRMALEALVVEHAWRLDHGETERLSELYVEGGRLLGIGEDLVGRSAIASWAAQRSLIANRRSRHVCTNFRFRAEAEDRVRGTVLLTLYRHDGDGAGRGLPLLVGDYEDLFVREPDERWLFAERRFVAAFTGAEA